MAEALLRGRLQARGVDARVASAGLTFEGRAATDDAVRVARKQGLDISEHSSRMMNAQMVARCGAMLIRLLLLLAHRPPA